MDLMSRFLENCEGKLNLRALIQSKNYLQGIQREYGAITFNDIKRSFMVANYMFNEAEIDFHRALIMETCLEPILGYDDTLRFRLRGDFMENELSFASGLLGRIVDKAGGRNYHCVEDFKRSVNIFLSTKINENTLKVERPNVSNTYNTLRSVQTFHTYEEVVPYWKEKNDSRKNFPTQVRKSVEFCEPVVRFLAQIRKQGMDILFPQDAHDKVISLMIS